MRTKYTLIVANTFCSNVKFQMPFRKIKYIIFFPTKSIGSCAKVREKRRKESWPPVSRHTRPAWSETVLRFRSYDQPFYLLVDNTTPTPVHRLFQPRSKPRSLFLFFVRPFFSNFTLFLVLRLSIETGQEAKGKAECLLGDLSPIPTREIGTRNGRFLRSIVRRSILGSKQISRYRLSNKEITRYISFSKRIYIFYKFGLLKTDWFPNLKAQRFFSYPFQDFEPELSSPRRAATKREKNRSTILSYFQTI